MIMTIIIYPESYGKLLEKYIMETSLEQRLLYPNQHAYQIGKSCGTALYELISPVEASIKILGYRRSI